MREMFINRTHELSQLTSYLHNPDHTAMLITGVGGIGKSALLNKFAEVAAKEGHWVHYIKLREVFGAEGLMNQIIETLSSGSRLIDKDLNQWKSLLTRTPQIADAISRLLRYPSAENSLQILERILHSIEARLHQEKLILIFDGLDELQFPERSLSLFNKLLDVTSEVIKFIFSSRDMSLLNQLTRFPNVYVLKLGDLTPSESHRFLSTYLSDLNLEEKAIAKLVELSQGIPLSLTLLSQLIRNQLLLHGNKLEQLEIIENFSTSSIEKVYASIFNRILKEKGIKEFLTAIALLYPRATTSDVKELTGFSTEKIEELSEFGLATRLLNAFNRDIFSFAHKSFHEFFVKNYIFHEGLDSSKIDFGAEEAERDKLLQGNFQFKQAIDLITSGQRTIIVGDRGAGKSSIFRFLAHSNEFKIPHEIGDKYLSHNKSTIFIPSDDPASFIQKNSAPLEGSNNSPEQYKAFWLLFVAVFASSEVFKKSNNLNSKDWKKLTSILKKMKRAGLISELEGLKENLLERVTGYFTKTNSKLSFSAGGIKLDYSPSSNQPNTIADKLTVDLEDLLKLINQIVSGQGNRIMVILDKVDEVYKYERPKQEALIQGLFLAESYLTRFSNISLVIFLRSDFHHIYDIQERNKLVSRSLTLGWNHKELFTLLLDRIRANKIFAPLNNFLTVTENDGDKKLYMALRVVFPEDVEGESFREWVINNMKNGNERVSPRQVILFLLLLKDLLAPLDITGEPFPIFKGESLKKAISKLSELSYDEVLNDFRVSPTFIRNLRAGKVKEFTLKQVEDLFSKEEGSIAQQIELLEKIGFLRRVVYTDEEKGYVPKFRIPELYTRCWDSPV